MGILDFFKNKRNTSAAESKTPTQSNQDKETVKNSNTMKSEYIIPEKNEYPRMYTEENIDRLFQNEIFVFGSNLQGHHAGGAARSAMQRFGAIWGQGVGLQGNSYAIPTMQGGVETIKPYVDEFVRFAEEHKELHFLVTRIGCGIAGFKDKRLLRYSPRHKC